MAPSYGDSVHSPRKIAMGLISWPGGLSQVKVLPSALSEGLPGTSPWPATHHMSNWQSEKQTHWACPGHIGRWGHTPSISRGGCPCVCLVPWKPLRYSYLDGNSQEIKCIGYLINTILLTHKSLWTHTFWSLESKFWFCLTWTYSIHLGEYVKVTKGFLLYSLAVWCGLGRQLEHNARSWNEGLRSIGRSMRHPGGIHPR